MSITAAKSDKLFYVVSNVILVNVSDKTCLLLKRGADEKEASGKWCFPGGKGEHKLILDGRVSDFFGIIALNESQEEVGLSFEPKDTIPIANGAFVREDGVPVVWVTLAAQYVSGDVNLEQGSFSEFKWFREAELPSPEACVGTVQQEAVMALRAFTA